MSDSPVVIPYSENSVPLSVDNNTTLVAGQRALVFAGFDGTKTQFLNVDTAGRVWVNVNGSVAVTGTVTANIGTTGGLALDATLTGGTQRTRITDGTNNAALSNTAPAGTEQALIVRNIPSGTQTVSVSNFPGTQPVSGTVAVSNFPATQPVSGTVTANQGTGAGAGSAWAARLSDGTNFYVGPSSAQLPTTLVSGRLDVNIGAAPFFGAVAATPPTSAVLMGGTDGAALRGLLVDSSGRVWVNVNGSVAVTGTVTANIGTTGGLALDATLTGGTQRTRITDGTNNVALSNAAPAGTEQGLIVRNIPSGTQAISAASLPLPTGAASEATLAGVLTTAAFQARINTLGQKAMTASTPVVIASDQSAVPVSGTVNVGNFPVSQTVSQGTGAGAAAPWSARLSDGTSFYIGTQQGQLPSALVGGRLDTNNGAWLGSTAPTVGQKAMTASLPVVIASDQSSVPVTVTGGSATNPSVGTNNAAIPASSTLVGGSDGTNLRPLRTRTNGVLLQRSEEIQSFVLYQPAVVVGNNKSMVSLLNAGCSTVVVRIESISIVNAQITAVTGVVGTFELRRITGHSAGVEVTTRVEDFDTANVLDANVTARTGATVAGESTKLLKRALWSTDEWGTGTVDVEAQDHSLQTLLPLFQRRTPMQQPIVLRAGEGLTVKFATHSTAGSFDIEIVFSQESAT